MLPLSHLGHTDISLIGGLFECFLILCRLRLLLGGVFCLWIAIRATRHIVVFNLAWMYLHWLRTHLIALFVNVVDVLVLGFGLLTDPLGH